MKTKEELNELKIEYESLSRKLAELTDDELEQVTGGVRPALKLDTQSVLFCSTPGMYSGERVIGPPVDNQTTIEAPPAGL